KDAQTVLAQLAPIRREVRSHNDRWYDLRLRPYRTIDDKIDGVVITFVDVTEYRRVTEELRERERELTQEKNHQHILLAELSHRVKNTLTVVQAISHQSVRSFGSVEEFSERFDGRLSALAGTHNLLVQSDWRGADFAALG